MANTYLGASIVWGVGGVASTLTGIGQLTLLEGADYTKEADKEEIRDGTGAVKQVTYYNQRASFALRFPIAAASVTELPAIGSTLSVADASITPLADVYIVEKVSITGTNTKARMAQIDLLAYLDGAIP